MMASSLTNDENPLYSPLPLAGKGMRRAQPSGWGEGGYDFPLTLILSPWGEEITKRR